MKKRITMKEKELYMSPLPTLNYKEIGLRIRKQRMFLGMTRDELAKHISITPTFLADIELGTKGFSLKSLNRFCNVLKMSSDAILYPPKNITEDKYESVINILERCPDDKIKIAENILTLYLISHDPVEAVAEEE